MKEYTFERLGVLLIFVMAPLEFFVTIPGLGTLSKLVGWSVFFLFSLRVMKSNKVCIPSEGFAFGYYLCICVASILWAVYPTVSISRSFTTLQILILYIIVYHIFSNLQIRQVEKFYLCLFWTGVLTSIYCIYNIIQLESISVWTRISITKEIDVNHLASFLIAPVLLGLHFSIHKSKKYIIPTVLILAVIFATQSRGGFISVTVVIFLYLLINAKKLKFSNWMFFLLSFIVFVFLIPPEFFYRISLMVQNKEILLSGSGRSVIWGWAWELFNSHPLRGIGVGNFVPLHRPPHSSFFQIAAELGLLGLGAAFLFLYGLLVKRKKHKRKLFTSNDIEFFIAIALLMMSLTVDIFYQKYFWIMLALFSAKKARNYKLLGPLAVSVQTENRQKMSAPPSVP